MTPPAFIGSMSSGRLFLGELLSSQSPPPLPRPCSCSNHPLPFVQQNTANGKQGLLTLSHSRGSPHAVKSSTQELIRNLTRKANKNIGLSSGNNLPQSCVLVSPNRL